MKGLNFLTRAICIIAVVLCVKPLSAQESNGILSPVCKSEIGALGGFSYYMGDFNESPLPYMVSPMFGIFYRHDFTKYVNLRAQLSFGGLKGDSREYEGGLLGFPLGVNLAFDRDFYSLDLLGEFNFMPFSSIDPRRKQIFSPYLIIGLGYKYYSANKIDNPHYQNARINYPMLYDSITSCQGLTIPMGFGFKFSPAHQWTLGVEWVFHKTNTDRIDMFMNRQSETSFNIYKKDWVSVCAISLAYRFVSSKPCAAYKTNKSNKSKNGKHRSK